MQELKYCPFCGGEAETAPDYDLPTTRYYIRCTRCACKTPACNRREGATEIWNKRKPPEPDVALAYTAIADIRGRRYTISCREIQEEGFLAGRARMWIIKIHGVPVQAIQFLRDMGADADSGISLSVCGAGFKPYYVGDITGKYCDLIEMDAHDEPVICKTLGGSSYAED